MISAFMTRCIADVIKKKAHNVLKTKEADKEENNAILRYAFYNTILTDIITDFPGVQFMAGRFYDNNQDRIKKEQAGDVAD